MPMKGNINGSHVIYVALYIKSASLFYHEDIKFQFFDIAFLFFLSVLYLQSRIG